MTSLRWSAGLTRTEQDAVRRLVGLAAAADGVVPVGEQALRDLSDGAAEHLLAGDPGGPAGYLGLAPGRDGADATAELVVSPAARCAGLGGRMIREAITRTGGRVRFWAHDTLPAARATARATDLEAVRELIRMRRPLAGLDSEVVLPQGIQIRTYAGPRDDAELLRVNNAAFAWHPEQGGWVGSDLSARLTAPWFDPAGLFLAVDDATGALLGFHWTKEHDGRVGEVYVVGVDPAAQGRGLGRAVTAVGLRHLAQRLAADGEVILYVESDNAAALATYRGLGFVVAAVDTAYSPRRAGRP